MNNSTNDTWPIGTEAIIVANTCGHSFKDGERVRLASKDGSGNNAVWESVDDGSNWYCYDADLERLLPIGTEVEITGVGEGGDTRLIGTLGTIVNYDNDDSDHPYEIQGDGHFGIWSRKYIEPTNAPQEAPMNDTSTAPTRPMVEFSGSSRATAREYARAINSRVLVASSRVRLTNAAAGTPVDAYDLNEALMDAMRSTATRCGQSMARRALATKVAYLAHITQAVIDNHADGLPAYPEGERSRKVKALQAEVDATKAEMASILATLEKEREAYQDVEARVAAVEADQVYRMRNTCYQDGAACEPFEGLLVKLSGATPPQDNQTGFIPLEERRDTNNYTPFFWKNVNVDLEPVSTLAEAFKARGLDERVTDLVKEKTALEVRVEDLSLELAAYRAAVEDFITHANEKDVARFDGFLDGFVKARKQA